MWRREGSAQDKNAQAGCVVDTNVPAEGGIDTAAEGARSSHQFRQSPPRMLPCWTQSAKSLLCLRMSIKPGRVSSVRKGFPM